MNDLQVLQNKAAKINLDRPLYSSATDALVTLKWLNLEQRRSYHRCIYIYKCINRLMDHSMNLLTNSDIHNYNTRNKDMLRLPRVTRNWGKQRVCHHSLKDWNESERETRNAPNIVTFQGNVFARFFNLIGENFCSFSFFALIIFYQFKVFNLIDDIFVVSASSLNCCFYQFVILSYILYFLTFCIFNI